MARNYTIEKNNVPNDKKTITVIETKQVTEERRVSIEELKKQYESILQKRKYLEDKADDIVDLLEEMETNLEIEIADKPARIAPR